MSESNRTTKQVDHTPLESRQAEIGHDGHVRGPIRVVLIVSTGLAVVALIIAYFAT